MCGRSRVQIPGRPKLTEPPTASNLRICLKQKFGFVIHNGMAYCNSVDQSAKVSLFLDFSSVQKSDKNI